MSTHETRPTRLPGVARIDVPSPVPVGWLTPDEQERRRLVADVARLTLLAARYEDIIDRQAELLALADEAAVRRVARVGRRPGPGRLVTALAAIGNLWASAWDWFETPASRASLRG